jgi:hypothetical protein
VIHIFLREVKFYDQGKMNKSESISQAQFDEEHNLVVMSSVICTPRRFIEHLNAPAPLCLRDLESGTGRRQNVFRVPQEPQGSCGSPVDPPVPGLVKHPGAPVRVVAVRRGAEDESA